jgi:hypothetical protein
MPEVKFDVEVFCTCGDELSIIPGGFGGQIQVRPCENCLEIKYQEGYTVAEKEFTS